MIMEGLRGRRNGLESCGVWKEHIEVVYWVVVAYSRGRSEWRHGGRSSGELPESKGSTSGPPREGIPPFVANMGGAGQIKWRY